MVLIEEILSKKVLTTELADVVVVNKGDLPGSEQVAAIRSGLALGPASIACNVSKCIEPYRD